MAQLGRLVVYICLLKSHTLHRAYIPVRYKSFIITNYRAITGPLKVDIDSFSILPIIGINESGKTTILQAIFAFDYNNDDLNEGRHIKETVNLYKPGSANATVSAEIALTKGELRKYLSYCEKQSTDAAAKAQFGTLKRRQKLPTRLTLMRDIVTEKYSFPGENFGAPSVHNALGQKIVQYLPFILYFDDFRDKVDEKIEIPPDTDAELSDWQEIIQRLFKETHSSYSIFDLPKMEIRQRKSMLAKVERKLNETLTKEWESFRLDDREALMISVEYFQAAPNERSYIKLEVVETDDSGDQHFFFISDRSKGFYWFFNFVMKLEFNSKVVADEDTHSVYLLDEPGSYLHALAQRKLCSKLKQLSKNNIVIYCTHSHYLLNPEVIPITSIVIADRDGGGSISTTRMIDYRGSVDDTRSAFQPVMDALQVKPYALELIHPRKTVIVEGIYDYFAYEMFRGERSWAILPSVGADSIKFYVSLMIAWQVEFRVLWDRDAEGEKKRAQAEEIFGSDLAKKAFRKLPSAKSDSKRILQNLFAGSDLVLIRTELGLGHDVSFKKTIQTLFYSDKKMQILSKVSTETKGNFDRVFEILD